VFYLPVVLEKNQIVDCDLDPENEGNLLLAAKVRNIHAKVRIPRFANSGPVKMRPIRGW
jgi:hypothetical protein